MLRSKWQPLERGLTVSDWQRLRPEAGLGLALIINTLRVCSQRALPSEGNQRPTPEYQSRQSRAPLIWFSNLLTQTALILALIRRKTLTGIGGQRRTPSIKQALSSKQVLHGNCRSCWWKMHQANNFLFDSNAFTINKAIDCKACMFKVRKFWIDNMTHILVWNHKFFH